MTRMFGFLDLETTGLDPDVDSIIEIAWTFTDETFEQVGAERSMLVEPRGWDSFWQAMRERPFVRDMHEKSGLLDAFTHSATESLDAVGELLLSDLAALPAHTSLHLAGYSVHFDRDFLTANGFRRLLADHFHHRHLDLSAMRLLLDTVGVPFTQPSGDVAHRALSDVRHSIEQARLLAAELRSTAQPDLIPAGHALIGGRLVALT